MTQTPVISVVDNEESVLASVGSLIRSVGLAAKLFYSAENFIRSETFSSTVCLISDVQMPEMSGLELQDLLNKAGRKIPTIFITGFAEPAVRERALAGGALCVLEKPFNSDELVSCIGRALNPDRQCSKPLDITAVYHKGTNSAE